jgi:hypothetical protein
MFSRSVSPRSFRDLDVWRNEKLMEETSQIFVANPHKPPAVASILRKNKDKLLVYLTEFHKDRDGEPLLPFLFPFLVSTDC